MVSNGESVSALEEAKAPVERPAWRGCPFARCIVTDDRDDDEGHRASQHRDVHIVSKGGC